MVSKNIRCGSIFLFVATILLAGCTLDDRTKTARGEVVREWFMEFPWGRVEAYALWPPDRGHSPPVRYPAILLLHGMEARAQRFQRAMRNHAHDGFIMMSISLPGFGASTGPEDYAGPKSVGAALGAVRYLMSMDNVRKDGIFIYGIGQGASTAALAAARSTNISGLILEDGFYDLAKIHPRLPQAQKRRMRGLLGGTPAQKEDAYRERSPLQVAGAVKASVLLLHSQGGPDPLGDAASFLKAIEEHGGNAELQKIKNRGPFESLADPNIAKWVIPFIRKVLKTRRTGISSGLSARIRFWPGGRRPRGANERAQPPIRADWGL